METYRAAAAHAFDKNTPLDMLSVIDVPVPDVPPGWTRVRVRAASVNHHDVWTLRGVLSHPAQPPVVLGTDAAGTTDDGTEVIVHAVLATGDDQRLLSEDVNGTLAEFVWVPEANLVPKPAFLSWAEAACLPTTWLTAWHMLVRAAQVVPGEHVLVQGATGGLATAAIQLAVAMGLRVTATSRSDAGLAWAESLGAAAVPTGSRLSQRADVVIDGVGGATATHSQRSLGFGGRWVVAGVTGGAMAEVDLSRVFWRQTRLIGATMGTRADFADLIRFLDTTGVRPKIGGTHSGLDSTREALDALLSGSAPGKHVVVVG